MSKFFKLSILAIVIAIAVGFTFNLSPVQANGTFDLYVKHNINGRSLGLDKELPVDVYVYQGAEQNLLAVFEDFKFGDVLTAELPADTYFIKVTLADESDGIMTLGPTEIPAGVEVSIRATLGAMKTPTLRVNVK